MREDNYLSELLQDDDASKTSFESDFSKPPGPTDAVPDHAPTDFDTARCACALERTRPHSRHCRHLSASRCRYDDNLKRIGRGPGHPISVEPAPIRTKVDDIVEEFDAFKTCGPPSPPARPE